MKNPHVCWGFFFAKILSKNCNEPLFLRSFFIFVKMPKSTYGIILLLFSPNRTRIIFCLS